MNATHFQIHFEEFGCAIYKEQRNRVDSAGTYVTWFVRNSESKRDMVCVHVRETGDIKDESIAKACLGLGIPVPNQCTHALEQINRMDDHLNNV